MSSSIMELNIFLFESSRMIHYSANVLEKLYQNKSRTLFLCDDDAEMNAIDKSLWTFSSLKFLPHARYDWAFANKQPILISTSASDYSLNNSENIIYIIKEQKLHSDIDNPAMLKQFNKIMLIINASLEDNLDSTEQRNNKIAFLKNSSFSSDIFTQRWITYQTENKEWIKSSITL